MKEPLTQPFEKAACQEDDTDTGDHMHEPQIVMDMLIDFQHILPQFMFQSIVMEQINTQHQRRNPCKAGIKTNRDFYVQKEAEAEKGSKKSRQEVIIIRMHKSNPFSFKEKFQRQKGKNQQAGGKEKNEILTNGTMIPVKSPICSRAIEDNEPRKRISSDLGKCRQSETGNQ